MGLPSRAALALALSAAACSSSPPPGPRTAATPPATSTAPGDRRPAAPDEPPLSEDDAARRGHALFDRACGPCHATAENAGGVLANLRLTPERMDAVIHAGSDSRAIMPVVPPGLLSEDDVPALIAYLRTIHAVR